MHVFVCDVCLSAYKHVYVHSYMHAINPGDSGHCWGCTIGQIIARTD